MLVLIGVDSFISLRYIRHIHMYRRPSIFLIALVICNLIYYFPILVFTQLISEAQSTHLNHSSKYVSYQDKENIIFFLDSINSTLLTCVVMPCLCIVLRKEIRNSFSEYADELHVVVTFARSSITLNISFMLMSLPLCVINVLFSFSIVTDSFYVSIANYFFQSNFCLSFFLLVITNSIVRDELLVMLGIRKRSNEI